MWVPLTCKHADILVRNEEGVLAQWMHEAVTWCHSLIFVKFVIHCCSKLPTCPFYPSLHSQSPPFVGHKVYLISDTVLSVALAALTAAATDSHSLPFLLLEIPVLWDPNKIPFRPSTSSMRTSVSVSEKFLYLVSFRSQLSRVKCVSERLIYIPKYSRGALHWPFMVNYGRARGGIFSFSTCALLQVDSDL